MCHPAFHFQLPHKILIKIQTETTPRTLPGCLGPRRMCSVNGDHCWKRQELIYIPPLVSAQTLDGKEKRIWLRCMPWVLPPCSCTSGFARRKVRRKWQLLLTCVPKQKQWSKCESNCTSHKKCLWHVWSVWQNKVFATLPARSGLACLVDWSASTIWSDILVGEGFCVRTICFRTEQLFCFVLDCRCCAFYIANRNKIWFPLFAQKQNGCKVLFTQVRKKQVEAQANITQTCSEESERKISLVVRVPHVNPCLHTAAQFSPAQHVNGVNFHPLEYCVWSAHWFWHLLQK